MKFAPLYLLLAISVSAAPFPIEQGRFDISAGWQTKNVETDPATNYFAVRTPSTNYVFVNGNTSSFSGVETGISITNDWWGGSRADSSTPLNWQAWAISNIDVVALSPGVGSFQLQFTNLTPGVYGVQIFGVVTNSVAIQAWRPPLQWRIVTESETNHVFGNYIAGRNYDIGQFWVQAVQPTNNILVTISLESSSLVSCKVVAFHFIAPIDYADVEITKSAATLFTAEEYSARTNYAQTNAVAGMVLDWKNNSPALPDVTVAANVTNLFHRWMPLNSTFDEASGAYATNETGSQDWYPHPYRSNSQIYGSDYAQAWGWTNIITSAIFTLKDFLNGGLVPGTSNDYVGFHYTNGYWVSTFGAIQGYGIYRPYIFPMVTENGSTSLPYRWFTFPNQTNAAHAAALILGKLAITYPSYRLEAMDINQQIKNPTAYLDYESSRWDITRTGKLEYDGWASDRQRQLAESVDYLWPYVSTSTVFAGDLTKFLPWINNSTTNVKILFSQFLRSLVFDNGYRASSSDPMQLGVVLQSGMVASNLMNPAEALIYIGPAAATTSPWKKHYAGTYNSSGWSLIGSMGYGVSENSLLTGPDLTRRYKLNGGTVGNIDISDASRWPKLAAFGDVYAHLQTAYGYGISFGDSSGGINEGPRVFNGTVDSFLVNLWRLGQNARLAKYIVDVRGRTSQTDSEWNAMIASAATQGFDLRYPINSRILTGVGVAALERGLGETNQYRRGSLIMRTVGGSGHQHDDHLDLNIYGLGVRMGTDLAVRTDTGAVWPEPNGTRVHNVVEIDGYNHLRTPSAANGWTIGNSGGGFSQYTAFSTNGSSQLVGADLWNSQSTHSNVNYQHRDSALVYIDATNSYVVDFQRVHGGRFYSWSFHGADVSGETAGFTVGVTLTNVTDYTSGTASSPGYFLRKHATNTTYGIKAAASGTNKVVAEWRLGRTATSAGSLLNIDGSGATVTTIAAEQAMFGTDYSAGSPRKYTRATLFDRSSDTVASAWVFSGNYSLLQPRLYVFTPGTQYYSNLVERSESWAALYDPYSGTRVVTSESSLATDSALTNAFMPKVIEVVTPAGTDRHYSSGTNLDVVAGGDTFNGTYGFTRGTTEFKLVGGTKLIHGGISLTTATNNLSRVITSVNYTNRTLVLSSALPVRRVGWYRIRNATHETSYYITSWTTTTNATFVGDPLVGEMDVSSVSGNTVTFTGAEGGMTLASYPKRGTGITGVNESRSKTFKADYSGSTTATRISGDSIATGDFTDVDSDGHVSAWFYDFGTGDTVEVPTDVWIQSSTNGYYVSANIGFAFTPLGTINDSQLTGEPQLFGISGTMNIGGGTIIIGSGGTISIGQ